MSAARLLTPAIRAATYETLIGLLSMTGMRAGEVLRLDRDDVDWDEGVLTVWDSKFGKSREIPLHPSALAALRAYAQRRDQLCPRPRTASFFVSPAGERLVYNTVQATFSRIIRNAGVGPQPPLRRARLHDMRHSFACIVLLGWYRDGADIEANLPLAVALWSGSGSDPYFVMATDPVYGGRVCRVWPLRSVWPVIGVLACETKGTPGSPAVVEASRSSRSPPCHCHKMMGVCHASTAWSWGFSCRTLPG